MSARQASCPGCAGAPGRNMLFCTVCWTDVPAGVRLRLKRAQTALGKSPSGRGVAQEFEAALVEAAGYVR